MPSCLWGLVVLQVFKSGAVNAVLAVAGYNFKHLLARLALWLALLLDTLGSRNDIRSV